MLRVLLAHLLTRHGRAVLYHYHLKVGLRLVCEAFEQFVHFVRTIVNGNNYAVFHFFIVDELTS